MSQPYNTVSRAYLCAPCSDEFLIVVTTLIISIGEYYIIYMVNYTECLTEYIMNSRSIHLVIGVLDLLHKLQCIT